MSEESVLETAAQDHGTEPSAGSMLRAAREATGLHIAALAVAMKVPVKKLEALEADRLNELPDAVFVRALAASMCRALKIDPAPVLSRLPQSAVPVFDRNHRGINMPYSTSGLMDGQALKGFVARPAVMAVLGLLVAALVVAFYPQSDAADGSTGADSAPPVSGAAPVASAPMPFDGSTQTGLPTLTGLAPAASVPPVATLVASASAAPALGVAPVAAASAVVSASDIVVFKASSSAWVRVSDSQGAVQFEKTLATGETASASGALPLSIVVGNVSATEVLVRGKPFAMTDLDKNNVARFEVK